jgi:hypothetical protein
MIFPPLAADIGRIEILQRSGRRRRRTQICDGKRGPGPDGSTARAVVQGVAVLPAYLGRGASPGSPRVLTYRACPGRRDWTAVGPTSRRPICELPLVHERPVRVGR